MAKLTKEEIVIALSEMSLIEISELVKAVEEKFGVSAAAPVAVAAAAPAEAAAAAPTEVTVTMKSFGANKVAVIKAVQGITGLGLMDAKKLVDGAPCVIKEKISPAEAEEIKAKLTEAGAEIEIK